MLGQPCGYVAAVSLVREIDIYYLIVGPNSKWDRKHMLYYNNSRSARLNVLLVVYKGARQNFEAKNWHQNFDWIFDRVWEIFFVKKYFDSKYWRVKSDWHILTSRQYFDKSSIFWQVVNILTSRQYFDKSSIFWQLFQYFDACVGSCQNFDQKFSSHVNI